MTDLRLRGILPFPGGRRNLDSQPWIRGWRRLRLLESAISRRNLLDDEAGWRGTPGGIIPMPYNVHHDGPAPARFGVETLLPREVIRRITK